ncbi:MAG: hypothetical protein M3512_05915 [Bacteroidota bacterium]|nr:hypothetical protein [Bacteroidota bacterium]
MFINLYFYFKSFLDGNAWGSSGNTIINFGDGSGDYKLDDVFTSYSGEEAHDQYYVVNYKTYHTFPSLGSYLISYKILMLQKG